MQFKANSAFSRLIWPFLNLASLVFKSISFFNIKIRALRQKEFPQLFIISVDNLSFGGTGKTPLVMAIGRALEKKGARFAIISRGYRSRYEKGGICVQNEHSYKEVGDEPMLLKASFPVQDVFIGRDRLRSMAAAATKNYRILILDDGFQSSHIKKDFSVMLVNSGHPYFYLRNFKFMRRRADRVLTYRPAGHAGKPTPADTYEFVMDKLLNSGGQEVTIGAAPIVAFSALGDNDRFENDMHRYRLAAFRGFSDHHAFSPADLHSLERLRKEKGGEWLVCSEKDFCKIKNLLPAATPLLYARNEIRLHNDTIEQIIKHATEKGFI
ncbi:MAG TPA: tetraacyldisaccharide 4'-kinase [Patescibacteria group bacterium]|nr:tetraacyldisaccharide 4'-kinase [Patescibacteria group bacterium]